jgi:heme exporter protein B
MQILKKDLRIEARTREVVVTTALFAVLVVVMASLSFYLDQNTAPRLAPGALWIAIAFAGLLSMGRTWARERDGDAIRALLLAPSPRAAIYLGKTLGSLIFVFLVELIVVPLVLLFFQVPIEPRLGWLVPILVLGTIGFVATGSLFASMTVRTGARDLALAVAVFPLVAPALLAAVVASREVFVGAPLVETLDWLRILGAFDIAFVAAGVVLFEPLMKD